MKKIMKKTFIGKLFVLVLISTLLLVSCGSKEETMNESKATTDMMEEVRTEETSASPEMDYGTDGMGNMEDLALENSPVTTSLKSDKVLASQVDSRKYIRTFRYYMETLTFDETVAKLDQLVDLNFGFYQSSETSGRAINASDYQRRSGSYVIRIPKEKVVEFTKGIESIGHILDKNNFVDDVTGQYVDMEARIKTLRVQEERLLAILEEADELEYIIQLERELSDVTYEIERYMSSFKELENQINYSTVYVDLNEVFEETVIVAKPLTFFEKMQSGFMDSVDLVVDFFTGLVLFLTTNIPLFILLAVFGFAIFKIIKRIIKPKKKVIKAKESQNTINIDLNKKDTSVNKDDNK